MTDVFSKQTISESDFSKHWRAMGRAEIDRFVRALMTAFEVVGVQEKKGRLSLSRIEDPTSLRLEFPPSVHSPKKFLFPNWEKLFRFRLDGKVLLEPEKAAEPRVIFGIHPCDIHAIRVLDDCLFEGEADTVYQAKREATVLIGVDCVPDNHCFCTCMGTDRAENGFDLFFHRLDAGYLVQTGSARGEALLTHFAPEIVKRPGEPPLPLQVKQRFNKLIFPYESLSLVLKDAYDDPLWGEIGGRCLGCGACNLLCPSCYCFNVSDRLDIDLEGGERVRTWDSCQLDQFSQVAGGSNFRSDQADRQRHRFFRKYKYLWEKHRRTACVGCGRCSRECLAEIQPTEVLNRLFEKQLLPPLKKLPGAEYTPQLAEIVAVDHLTEREKSFRLHLADPCSFSPGAFLEVSVFGLGEAPFTIASPPGDGLELDVVVRATGTLTQALHRLRSGDTVGVRGPFGNGFPVEDFLGKDVLLVAGGLGMVTLRSLLLTILNRRTEFGRVTLLYGARNFESFLFLEDLSAWHRAGEIDCRFITKEPSSGWAGLHGDVTLLFKDLDISPQRSIAAVSGPAGMYRFTNPLLFRLGFQEDQVYLNLERHMKCGLGKCGKCQINDICVCEAGPIFPYSRIKHLREAIER